ncbi:MAG TPA: hypothetical protein VGU20_20470 [Stellaceae bacterium]|nr:hypothetical protein [Stellaceae bacterium]
MAPLDGGDRVELNATKPLHAGFDVAILGASKSRGESLRRDDMSAQIGEGKQGCSADGARRAIRPILLPIFAANTDS